MEVGSRFGYQTGLDDLAAGAGTSVGGAGSVGAGSGCVCHLSDSCEGVEVSRLAAGLKTLLAMKFREGQSKAAIQLQNLSFLSYCSTAAWQLEGELH
jgi:hypothetical protein